MALSIRTQPMLIDWETKDAEVSIKQNHRNYEVTSTKPELKMETTHPKVTIDQSEQFKEAGIESVMDFMRSNAAYARQQLSAGVDNIVSEGNRLMAIENPENPIPDMAVYNAFIKNNEKEFNFALIPSPTNRPDIQLIRGEIKTEFIRGEVDVKKLNEKAVEVSATAPNIRYFVKQYNSIEIQHIDETV